MPEPACRHRADCRLCGSRRVEVALPLRPSPLADAYVPASKKSEPQPLFPMDLYMCRDCGHAQLLDVVDPEVLFRNYLYESATSSPGLVEHFEAYAKEALGTFRFPMGALAVDIGSNDGTLLRFLAKGGLRVLGVDPAREVAARATASGVRTVPDFFSAKLGEKLAAEEGRAALVTSNNAFAHSDWLADMADGVRALLAPDGVFVFEVSYLVDLVAGRVFDFVYHEHLSYHSVKPLRTFLDRHGLELFDARRIPIKGGSLRCFAQPKGGPKPVAASIARLLALEDEMALYDPKTYRDMMKLLDGLRAELVEVLEASKKAGRRIAGYGASATTTTLLYHFQLGPYVEFLVDDNAGRQGLFSPGLHLPVLAPQALYHRKADDLLVLAWRYAASIEAKHPAWARDGRRFIVPLPELRIR